MGVACTDTTPPQINCTADIGPGDSATVTLETTVTATGSTVLNGAYVDPENVISETNDDADDSLDCSDVGEPAPGGGDPPEPDNYACTRHTVGTMPLPMPGAGMLHNCPLSGKWAISVWEGPSGTATADALSTCTEVTVDAAYSLDRATNGWSHYFPGSAINTLLSVDDMQAIITHGQ